MREINNIILANIRNRKFWKFWKKLQLLCEIYARLRRNIDLWDIRYLFDKKICRFIGIRRDIVSNIFSIRGITFFYISKARTIGKQSRSSHYHRIQKNEPASTKVALFQTNCVQIIFSFLAAFTYGQYFSSRLKRTYFTRSNESR